ncbi:MAG: potassium transporter, partial [Isosphaeraceae bacterium]
MTPPPPRRLAPRYLNRPNRFRIHLRFLKYLLWEFRWPLGVFALLIYGGGLALHWFYHAEEVGYAKAVYSVFLMVFLESGLEFPEEWYLQPLFFLVPVIGL